jgi:hypothetical protein
MAAVTVEADDQDEMGAGAPVINPELVPTQCALKDGMVPDPSAVTGIAAAIVPLDEPHNVNVFVRV